LSTAQIAAFTTAQAAVMTTDQIVAFTTAQIAGLGTAAISAMSAEQALSFETSDLQQFSSAQMNALLSVTPIVLDLDGNGIQTIAASNGVIFDVTATGNTANKFGWVGGNDALLVRDRNGDGKINDGTELYGSGTKLADGSRAGNGFSALAQEDSNHDGKISAADAGFKDIKLWVDGNRDGVTDAGELRGLADFGIVELNLERVTGTAKDNGNLIGLVSSYTKSDGSSNEMSDVWFAKDTATKAADAPKLTDLLAAPQGELLAGSAAAPAAATAVAPVAPAAFQLRGLLEDDNRQAPLL